jgi:hypothetical protein
VCLPLKLSALNRTPIYHFGLDVEGLELSILQTILGKFLIIGRSQSNDKLSRGNERLPYWKTRGYSVVFNTTHTTTTHTHFINDSTCLYVDDHMFVKLQSKNNFLHSRVLMISLRFWDVYQTYSFGLCLKIDIEIWNLAGFLHFPIPSIGSSIFELLRQQPNLLLTRV